MKRTLILIGIVIIITGLLASSSYASGSYAGEYLNIGVGARALGMGGAFIGVANDATAAYWNPAGMGGLHKKEVTLMHCPASFESLGGGEIAGQSVAQLGAEYNFIGGVMKLGSMRVGMSMIQLKIDEIWDTRDLLFEDVDENEEWDPDIDGKVFYDIDRMYKGEDVETAYIVSLSQNLSPGFSIGANVKLLSQSIFEYTASGYGIDVGLMYRMNPGNPLMGESSGSGLSVGLVARDILGTEMNWGIDEGAKDETGHVYFRDDSNKQFISVTAPESAMIPLGVGGGVAYTMAMGASSLTMAWDVMMRTAVEDGNGYMDMSLGMEMWVVNMLAIRCGVKQLAGAPVETGKDSLDVLTASFGVGLKLADMIEMNYAFSGFYNLGPQDNSLGGSHRASMAFRF